MTRTERQPIFGPPRTPARRRLLTLGLAALAIGTLLMLAGWRAGDAQFRSDPNGRLDPKADMSALFEQLLADKADSNAADAPSLRASTKYEPPTYWETVLSTRQSTRGIGFLLLGAVLVTGSWMRLSPSERPEELIGQSAGEKPVLEKPDPTDDASFIFEE